MKNLAIIPARSGSKGLKDKNIKLLNGKPLIAYTIEAAKKSGLFNEIFVSTDSEKYAKIAQVWGANVPFLRSDELSTDIASSWDVVREAINKYKENGKEFDTIALLQPTSPLRTADDIIAGYNKMKQKFANSIVSVCETDHSPLWSNTLPEDNSMVSFVKQDIIYSIRQDLPTYYQINGALYIVRTNYLMSNNNIYKDSSFATIMSRENSIDIDTRMDFIIADALMKDRLR